MGLSFSQTAIAQPDDYARFQDEAVYPSLWKGLKFCVPFFLIKNKSHIDKGPFRHTFTYELSAGSAGFGAVDGQWCFDFGSISDTARFKSVDPLFTYDGPITICTWARPVGGVNSGLGGAGTDAGQDRCFVHFPWGNNTLYWDYGATSGGRESVSISSYLSEWHHYAFVSAGAPGSYQAIVIDGSIAASQASSNGPNGGWEFNIGHGVSWYWNGAMAEIAMWHRQLTMAEIRILARRPGTMLERRPVPIIVPEQAAAGDVVTPNDCTHSHTADQITLTQIHNLQINEASHAHTADNITLAQVHNLQVAECTHAHTADALTLTQVHTVTPADCLHAHTADSLTLTQIHNLVISECTHTHSADSIVIGQIHNLVISECLHAHTADNVTITEVTAGAVVPDAATHTHTADNIVLGQVHNLQLDAATHGHTADSLVLVQVHNLIISECLHAHTADNITITQVVGGAVVTPDDSDHGHTADNIVLTQIHNLIVAECLHAHAADNATVQLAGIPTQPGMEFTSRGRRQHYTLYGRQHYTLRED